MTQSIIDIGDAPNDGTGEPVRTSFDKVNSNFAELYKGAGGAAEGLWNFHQTDTNTSTAPVSGRFKTNSGNYRDATQIAIHGVTVQGVDRTYALQKLLAGDIIQCQDSAASSAWCRFILQSAPVNNSSWFQLNVVLETDGGVASGDNQEIVFVFTANKTGAAGAPLDADYITSTANATLTSERVLTDTATVTWDRTTPGQIKATAGGGTATPAPPQGRLTLQTATPVMTSTQSAKTTLFYTPYVGNQVPIYDGTTMTMPTFAELSVATTDTTKSPAAIGASKVNDWFVWSDAGTIRIGHGPDWTNDTTRSAGTALIRVNGIWLNNASITNGPAASRGTYVGTTRSNASSQLDWIYGAVAAGGTAGFFGVWNAYNRVSVGSIVGDNADSWIYGTTTWRSANGSANMRFSYVSGLAEDIFDAYYGPQAASSGGIFGFAGIGYDVTNAYSGINSFIISTVGVPAPATFATTSLGFHFFQAVEYSGGASTVFFGDNGLTSFQTGMKFAGRM